MCNINIMITIQFSVVSQEDSTLENGAKKLKEWKDELGKWKETGLKAYINLINVYKIELI